MEIVNIPITHINIDENQPRKHHSEESLRGLADSIRQHGLLSPITVDTTETKGHYRILTGERRWRAAAMVNLETIPCLVKNLPDEERLTVQLIENLQREDLQPIEKARALQHIKSALNQTNREIARRLGLSERSVAYLLELLDLPEDIGEAIVSSPNRPAGGQLTEKHGRFLKQLNAEPDLQAAVVERIRNKQMSSEETGNLVKALKRRPDLTDEIMSSPSEHLLRFFREEQEEDISLDEPPLPASPFARQILDFLPLLSGLNASQMSHPDLRQVEDALTSLKIAVEGLLRACKKELGD